MQFNMRELDRRQRYKIIGQCVTPRPIAWVSTLSTDGAPNLAPFSFFNALGDDPPTIALGMAAHPDGRLKDTPTNIRETGEFVVNLVDEAHAEAMNLTSIDVSPDTDESRLVDLKMVPCTTIKPARISTAPVSFECRTLHWIETGKNQVAIIGEVLHVHIADQYLIDLERILIDVPAMKLIARLHGAGWYGRQTDQFEMLRPG